MFYLPFVAVITDFVLYTADGILFYLSASIMQLTQPGRSSRPAISFRDVPMAIFKPSWFVCKCFRNLIRNFSLFLLSFHCDSNSFITLHNTLSLSLEKRRKIDPLFRKMSFFICTSTSLCALLQIIRPIHLRFLSFIKNTMQCLFHVRFEWSGQVKSAVDKGGRHWKRNPDH